jgi:hypothetical protein
MNRNPRLRGIVIAAACALGLLASGWHDADARGRGGGGGGGMSRSSPARSGGMSSRPAPQRSPQTSNRQAAPSQRPAGQTPSTGGAQRPSQPSAAASDRQGTRQGSQGERQGSRQEDQGQRQDDRTANQDDRQEHRDEAREDRQDYRDDVRDDRQDYYDDWDGYYYGGYYGYDDDWGEALVIGVAVGAVVASADDDDDDTTTTVTNVTNVTQVTALASLPCEASITVANGINYCQCGANWYTRAYQGDTVVYVPSGPPPSKRRPADRPEDSRRPWPGRLSALESEGVVAECFRNGDLPAVARVEPQRPLHGEQVESPLPIGSQPQQPG